MQMQSQKPIAWIDRSKDPEASQVTADDEGNTPNGASRIPRLAYSNLSRTGAWREGVKSRNDRNIFETQHGFYKAEIPAQLQHDCARDEDEHAEQSYLFEGAWDVNTRTGSPTSASSLSRISTGTSESSSISSSPFLFPSYSSSSFQPRHLPLHLRTPFFSNPDFEPITQDPINPSSPTLSAATLDALLDAGREALRSTAGAEFEEQGVCAIDDNNNNRTVKRNSKSDPKEALLHPLPHLPSNHSTINITTPFPPTFDWKKAAEQEKQQRETERKDQQAFAQSVETAVSNGIVGVQNWYKISGAGEVWREMDWVGREDLVGLV